MPRLIHISPKAHAAARRASRRWLLAGLAGGAVTATCAHAEVFQVLPLIADALATLAAGALTMFIVAPHRLMRTFTDDLPAIDELSQRVRALADGDRSQPLTELIMDRDDAIGRLTVAIHDLAAETVTTRSHSRLMHKRMDTEVDRKTRQATAELERQANTDPLTGLGNRREMEKQLDKMLRSRVGSRRQMTIVAIDLDRFKQVNDTLGHEVGDQCLSFLGDLFKSCLRREDCPIRLGGNEFVVILPDQTMEDADAVSRRLKTLYAMMPWPAAEPARPTLSIGAATNWITTVDEAVDLLRRADDALYDAKHAGRSTTRRGAA